MLNPKRDAEKLKETWGKIEEKAPVTSSVIKSSVIISKWLVLTIVAFIALLLIIGSIPGTPWNPTSEQLLREFVPDRPQASSEFVPKTGRRVAPAGRMMVRVKSTGQIGTIPIGNFSANVFEAL